MGFCFLAPCLVGAAFSSPGALLRDASCVGGVCAACACAALAACAGADAAAADAAAADAAAADAAAADAAAASVARRASSCAKIRTARSTAAWGKSAACEPCRHAARTLQVCYRHTARTPHARHTHATSTARLLPLPVTMCIQPPTPY